MSPISQVINDSISSAICIDDKYVAPYQEPDKEDKLEDSKTLYKTFRKEGNCDLDIYKYESLEKFGEDEKSLFNNKDLLILDWELKDDGVKYVETLPIIEKAINADDIQFIVIYTNSEAIEDIVLKIFSYFKYKEDEREIVYSKYKESDLVTSYFDEPDELIEILSTDLKGFVLNPSKRKEIRSSINVRIRKLIDNKSKSDNLCADIRSLSWDLDEIYEWFECYDSNCEMGLNSKHYDIQVISKEDVGYSSLIIDNTLITVIGKAKESSMTSDLIEPEKLYSTICSIVKKLPNKISTILSLEIKNIYKKHINSFGRGFMGIKEAALVEHAKKYDKSTQYEEFYDFILSCWNSQVTDKIKEEVKTLEHLESEIESYSEKPAHADIAKLNSYLTFAKSDSEKGRRIKFGDIFQLESGVNFYEDEKTKTPDTENYRYLICLTQECDCLRPYKINSNFVFAIGKRIISIEEALQKVETDNYSFVNDNLVIQWQKKFMTVNHQTTNKFDPKEPIPFSINSTTLNATFLGNQKDTITQRLANSIYSNAMRIGVDLPNLQK